MKKLVVLLLGLTFLLVGCFGDDDEEVITPYDELSNYISLWESEQFEELYSNHITEHSRETFSHEDFVERYEHLYDALSINNLSFQILREDLDEEEVDELEELETFTLPLEVSFDTLAGAVEYELDVTLEKLSIENVDRDEVVDERWLVEWHPEFILPNLEQDEEVSYRTLTAKRGDILDRHELALATVGEVYEVGVTPENFDESDLSTLADSLKLTEEYIENKINQSWVQPEHFVPIRNIQLTDEEMVSESTAISGVTTRVIEDRVYPFAEAAAHLTGYIAPISAEELEELEGEGYTSSDRVGKRGLEQLFESKLRGQNGAEIYINKQDGSTYTVAEQEAQDGEDVQLTIDIEVQEQLFRIVDGDAGTATVMDPASGDIISLLSFPTFDPNQFVLGMTNSQYEELMSDENLPTINRFSSTYSPGSTMKLFTSVVGFQMGVLDPNEVKEIEGLQWQKDSWDDYHVTRVNDQHTEVDLDVAMKYSDNIYFAMLGLDIGGEAFKDGLETLGFGESLPFAYPVTTTQISNSGSFGSEGQIADSSFGQGEVLINNTHLAALYAGVANDGVYMEPRLLLDESEEVWFESIIEDEENDILQDTLRNVVAEGTATDIDIEGREMAGKTGTAELKASHDDEDGAQNGIFVSYDQANPNMLLSLMIENVEDLGGSGYTVELSKEFFESIE
ncbi:penicillin-binding transpeptidase domain-containing protein [Alkalibacillus haloalkaliphilus]|uniref:penicillin-binding transpeptidase domain-containing protein n=1 Tax=Alkalibacillus haloalkaliphilus TaxID=94136 RepID=UPI0003147FEE|nr:penicillin-binding transpeptidase domain-containing protein [Alkalibacillus haloalkaliphilus]